MKVLRNFKFLLIIFVLGCNSNKTTPIIPQIIPIPSSQTINEGSFLLNKDVGLQFENELKTITTYFNSYIKSKFNFELKTLNTDKKITFSINSDITNDEGYTLTIEENSIKIEAKTQKGAFYAVQSLIQLLPVSSQSKNIFIQNLTIEDDPQFKYRGMHLDVGRHMFSVDFIKKYIDIMSMLKMNTFHWHLTEDQGWRIEIKKYPKLQKIAAFRNETLIGHYNDQPHKFDGKKYGGFYTQEEIKDIVQYASKRQITIIPEIEMPGHSQAAIAAYPELGCTGKQIEVATKWGVFEEVYCTKEATFKFLEDVIDEVIELFPGKYIHIGGDEAPKTQWKNCDHCQQIIKKEGLKNEHGLQSYFITRMEKYINSKGKQIIGWDEILEGGLAPNATVMSWRGTKGAVEAAKQKHPVILTPGSHCYFDHYQSENENEPIAIGGFLPLEKVYNFNPIPDELNQEESKYVLGAQGNVWTEYMKTSEKVEYMAFPRMIALSEVVWSSTENKDYEDFINRLEYFNKILDNKNVNYANHLYEVKGELLNKNGKLNYHLKTTTDNRIVYTLDEKDPSYILYPEYKEPILIDSSTTIKAAVFNSEGNQLGNIFEQRINLHKAVGKKISLNVAPNKKYDTGGIKALINGISGNNKRYGDSEWLGFSGEDIEITIDLGKPTEINSISTRFHNGQGQWIYAPKHIAARIILENDDVVANKFLVNNDASITIPITMKFNTQSKMIAKKIVLIIPNYGKIPEGKQGAGHKPWTFIDEIIIE